MESKVNYVGNRAGLSDSIIDRMAFVSLNYVDDTYTHQFSTIQAAIDWAYGEYGAVTDFANPVVIKIEPGIYTEQIHSYAGYYLIGEISGFYSIRGRPPPTLYNTGAAAATWPLRSSDGDIYQLVGMNIQTDVDGVIGKLATGDFMNCFLKNGHFIERTEAGSGYNHFRGCTSSGNTYGGFNLTGAALTSTGWLALNNCSLTGAPVFSSTHTTDPTVAFSNTFINGHLEVSGDWNFYTALAGCNSWGEAVRHSFDTTGKVKIYGGSCVNGIHFTSAPSVLEISGLTFSSLEDNQIPAGEADITADVPILADYFTDVNAYNGLCGNIQTSNPVKSVGGDGSGNQYLNVQAAIDSIGAAGTGVVDLKDSFIDLAELTIPAGANVTIDGHKLYSLTFTADVVELGTSEQLVFYGLASLNGGNIEVNGNSAYVGFEECLTVAAYVTLTAGTGTYCLVYSSTIKAPSGFDAITLNNTDSIIIVGYSRVDGGTGKPAILFTVEANANFKAKFSTFIYGAGVGDVPPLSSTAADSDIEMYSCGMNKAWTATHFTNQIGTANNTTDPQINF